MAPLCAVLAVVVGLVHHDALLIGAEIIAICVVPVACLPVAALVGIRWPYHPLQLRYRWDHRVPLRRMIVRWLILAVVPYALVPALCLLMTVPAFILRDRRPHPVRAGLPADGTELWFHRESQVGSAAHLHAGLCWPRFLP